MPSWLLKSFVQRAISVLPRPQKWNELFQKHVTKSLGLTEGHCAGMVALARRHLDVRWRHSLPENFTVFEVGTGWYPVAPVVAILCGADKVWTFDIDPLLSAERLERMLGHLRRFAADGRLGAFLPNLQKNRLSILCTDEWRSGGAIAGNGHRVSASRCQHHCPSKRSGRPLSFPFGNAVYSPCTA